MHKHVLSPQIEESPESLNRQVSEEVFGQWEVVRLEAETQYALDKDIGEQRLGRAAVADMETAHDIAKDNIVFHGHLIELRDEVDALNQEEKETINEYLNEATSPFIRDQYEQYRKRYRNSDWCEWLSRGATSDQFANFLQWHVDSIAQQQTSEAFQARIAKEKHEYKAAVQKAIQDGWLHAGAQAAIDKVDAIQVYVGDIFDSLILQKASGYHTWGSGAVVLAAGTGKTHQEREANLLEGVSTTLKHEFNHAVLGDLPYSWVREAVTENIANIFETGELKKSTNIYDSHRKLLGGLLWQSGVKVPTRLLTYAYSDPEGVDSESYKLLTRVLDAAWETPNVLGTVQGMIDFQTRHFKRIVPHASDLLAEQWATEVVQEHLDKNPKLFFATQLTEAA